MNLLPASRLKNLHCADDNEKAWILFSLHNGQLVYIKPFRNAVKLIVIILWYFLYFHGLYGLYGPQCLLSTKMLLNLITLLHFYVFDIIFTICCCTNCSFLQFLKSAEWERCAWASVYERCFGWNLLDMWSPAEVSIDCKAKEVTFCHSFNWLWIYCQLQGLKNLHCADDNEKAWILFSYIKEHLVYIKPFQNAFNLIVDILWYFFHHVFGRCWVAKQTQMTYQNLYYLDII